MHKLYEEFMEIIESENKEKSIEFAINKLTTGEVDIKTLYKEILEPSLNNIGCKINEDHLCIWREHVRTSIVRTIIECCYPFIIKERKQKSLEKTGKRVIVICPDGEYHDIGARMVADIFTLSGFETIFIGSSTPKEEFISAIDFLTPQYIAMSVTNYYNLVSAKKTVDIIRNSTFLPIKILVGGHAFYSNPETFKKFGADLLIKDFEDIEKLAKEENAHEISI